MGHRHLALLVVCGCLLAGCGSAVLSTPPWSGSSAASSAATTAPPGPLTAIHALDASELRAAIEAQRAGGLAPLDVVTDAAIDGSRRTAPLSRECVPTGHCLVIGTLAGFGDPEGTVAIREQDQVLPPATDVADLWPPVALRLSGSGPIEFLGHVRLAGTSATWTVADALAATATAPDGQVVAVDGWLVGSGIPFSCGPAPLPGPPVPAPFGCHTSEFLTAEPVKPISGGGGSYEMGAVPGSVSVQEGAYAQFAPGPASDGMNDVPRRATYLLRMVVYNAVNCPGCRGWLMVGRLDAAPTAVAATPGEPVVRSADELAALLASNRSAWVGRAMVVDGQVLPGRASGCRASELCAIGTLVGTNERVEASAYTASMLYPDTDFPTNGVMALLVRGEGLEYFGYLGYNASNGFTLPVASLADPMEMNHRPLIVFVVTGWLVDSGTLPLRCPAQGVPPPPDTPFGNCESAWLTADAVQPVTATASGISVVPPPGGIRVQAGAYTGYAPNPATEPDGIAHVPRRGTYLVRLVADPRPGADPAMGWQVVARLDP